MEHVFWHDLILRPEHPGSGTAEDHEAEKARFDAVLDLIRRPKPVMVELGAYWAIWTILFGKRFPDASLVIVEPDAEKLQVGLDNFALNGLAVTAFHNVVAPTHTIGVTFEVPEISLDEIESGIIDLLHMDIQGAEFGLYEEVDRKMKEGRIKHLVMATHDLEQHETIVSQLQHSGHSVATLWSGRDDGEIIAHARAS